jgi:hypothetical protein
VISFLYRHVHFMERIMRKGCAISVLLGVSTVAWAAGWSGPYEVSAIEASDTVIYFQKPDGMSGFPNPDGCANAYWVAFDANTPIGARALAIGLAAQASGRKVKYFVNGCLGGYIKATSISIDPSW